MLIPQNPHCPLAKLLLVLSDNDSANESAIDWTVKLARSNDAVVTVLPLLLPLPVIHGPFIQHSFQSLLETNDPIRQKMRWIAQRFIEDEIKGIFKLRDGPPMDQLYQEMIEYAPDLIVIAASSNNFCSE